MVHSVSHCLWVCLDVAARPHRVYNGSPSPEVRLSWPLFTTSWPQRSDVCPHLGPKLLHLAPKWPQHGFPEGDFCATSSRILLSQPFLGNVASKTLEHVQHSPQRLPSCSKMPQHGSMLPQDSLKMSPRWPPYGSKGFQQIEKLLPGGPS